MDKTFRPLRRAVLFGIDGGGTYFEQASTPFMDRIFAEGAVCRRTLTEIPTVSAECWGAMLHGVDRHDHQLTNWIAGVKDFPADSPYPSVFRVIREARPDAKLAAFSDWNPINRGIIEADLGVHKYSDRDFALIRPALDYIAENDFTLLFFQFDSVDGAGHRFGYGSPEHLASITTVDMYIRYITDAIRARGWGDDTLFLVEADHGGYGQSHGGVTDEEKYVTFLAAGSGLCHGEITGMEVRDTSSVILHALGIPQPAGWTGRVPGGLFPDVPETLPRPAGIHRPDLVENRKPIPEKGELLTRFAGLEPQLYLPFDENAPSLAPGCEQHGKFYRVPGVAGDSLRFDDGWMALTAPDMTDGFSFAVWMRVDSLEKPVYVFSTRKPAAEKGEIVPGVHMWLQQYLRILMSDAAGKPHNILAALPEKLIGVWTHFLVSVDLAGRRLQVWVNFEKCVDWEIPADVRFDLTAKKVYIAQDATEGYPDHIPAALDDFCVFAKPFADGDAARLCAYYNGK